MSEYTAGLKGRVLDLQNEVDWLTSKLESFFTGNVPPGASLEHMLLAQWGRKRLDEKAKQPALLVKPATI
jgi:hypothetical protein